MNGYGTLMNYTLVSYDEDLKHEDGYIFTDCTAYDIDSGGELKPIEDLQKYDKRLKKVIKHADPPIKCLEVWPKTMKAQEQIYQDPDWKANVRRTYRDVMKMIRNKEIVCAVWHKGDILSIFYR